MRWSPCQNTTPTAFTLARTIQQVYTNVVVASIYGAHQPVVLGLVGFLHRCAKVQVAAGWTLTTSCGRLGLKGRRTGRTRTRHLTLSVMPARPPSGWIKAAFRHGRCSCRR
ncbi:unnamed protein product [Ectocarpus sp. 13 AM-2016]